MSVELMGRVWKEAPVNGSELLVLLALADFGNDDGSGIYPSINTIAKKARLSGDQARRVVHKLIAMGLVELVEIGGWDGKRNRPNEYKITLQGAGVDASTPPAPMPPPSPRRRQGGTRAGASMGTRADATTVPAPVQDDPLLEPSIEPSKQKDDPHPLVSHPAREAVHAAWRDQYGEPMPANLIASIDGLTVECGSAAVIHGIAASFTSQSRNFQYIAKCARNYVPPATNGQKLPSDYAVALPPAAIPRDPPPRPVAPRPPLPRAQDNPWAICLAELLPTLQGSAQAWLTDSTLAAAGDVQGVPLYRVTVAAQHAAGVQWLTKQAGVAIRRTLGSVLGRPVLVEIVAADATSEVAP